MLTERAPPVWQEPLEDHELDDYGTNFRVAVAGPAAASLAAGQVRSPGQQIEAAGGDGGEADSDTEEEEEDGGEEQDEDEGEDDTDADT